MTADVPDQPHPLGDEATLTVALKPFGWTCGPGFWQRYYQDAWVFNLANAVERLHATVEAQATQLAEMAEAAVITGQNVLDLHAQLADAHNVIADALDSKVTGGLWPSDVQTEATREVLRRVAAIRQARATPEETTP